MPVTGVQTCALPISGLLSGDENGLAAILFAQVHGLSSLELTGWLGLPERADVLWDRSMAAMLQGLGAWQPAAEGGVSPPPTAPPPPPRIAPTPRHNRR